MSRYADAVTGILLKQGDDQARGLENRGQIWGNFIQGLPKIAADAVQMHDQRQAQAQQQQIQQQQIASNKALEEERTQQTAERKDAAARLKDVDALEAQAFTLNPDTGTWGLDRSKFEQSMIQGGHGQRYFELVPHLDAIDAKNAQAASARRGAAAQVIIGIEEGGNTPELMVAGAATLRKNKFITDEQLMPILEGLANDDSPAAIGKAMGALGATLPEYGKLKDEAAKRKAELAKTTAEAAKAGVIEVNPGNALVDPATGVPKYTAQPKPAEHSPIYKEWQDHIASGGTLSFDAYQTADANRKRPTTNVSLSGMNSLYTQTDPQAIADGIRRGEMPPDISQYGRPVQGAVASILAKPTKDGEPPFALANAQRIWASQKRLNATMNGGQQVRLDESIKSGLAMYDKVDEIAERWQGKGLGTLSRANLKLAKEGGLGKEAAAIANELEGQIGQLTSDIATIEQGGLTPTNESRAVAEKSMQAWWGAGTIKRMTAQGRANMRIRETARADQRPFTGGNTGPGGAPLPAVAAPVAAPGKKMTAEELLKKYGG